MEKQFDICISGAGPAGTVCALALKDSGLKIGLFDKEVFPRIKPCGDAIPGKAFKLMDSIDPELGKILWDNPKKEIITASRIVAPNYRELTIDWVNKAYNCPRQDFDNYLLDMVKKKTNVEVFEGTGFINAIDNNDHIELETINNRERIIAKFVIGADGANSIISRKLAGFKVDHKHNCTALRAYYKNVSDLRPGLTELFFIKKYLPGYFWIFPVGNHLANIGFGMLSETIIENKVNINHAFTDILKSYPQVSKRLENAELVGEVKGHNLPLGSRQIKISGNRFLLVGDAASLIDPIDGHGIDKAMLSGKMAADQVIKCFSNEDFSAESTVKYQNTLYKNISPEMKKNYDLLNLLSKYPGLLNTAVNLAQIPFLKKRFLNLLYG